MGAGLVKQARRPTTVKLAKQASPPAEDAPYPAPTKGLPDGLTSDWLTGLLRHHKLLSDSTTVTLLGVHDIYGHNGIVFRIAVSYHGETALPTSFVLKLTQECTPNGEREALFYNKLASSIPFGGSHQLTIPRRYWAVNGVRHCCEWRHDGVVSVPDDARNDTEFPLEAVDEPHTTAILMGDAGEHDIHSIYDRFPTPGTCNMYLSEAKLVLQRLAVVHAAWWDQADAMRSHPELAVPRPYCECCGYEEMLAADWSQVRPLLEPFPTLATRYGSLVEAQDAIASAPPTLLHGDLCPANFMIGGTSVCLFDWAEINVGSAAMELDGFLWRCNLHADPTTDGEQTVLHGLFHDHRPGASPVASVEVICELLRTYHSELVEHGVDTAKYPFEALVAHFVVASMLTAMGQVLCARGENVERTESASKSATTRLALLQSLCTMFLE